MARTLSGDYDADPERFRSGQETVKRYGLVGDVHQPVAKRFAVEGLAPTLDLSTTMLRKAPPPRV